MRTFDEQREAYLRIRAAASTVLSIDRGTIEELLREADRDVGLVGRLNPTAPPSGVAARAGAAMLRATLAYRAELARLTGEVRGSMGQGGS